MKERVCGLKHFARFWTSEGQKLRKKMSNANRTELIGINALERALLRSPFTKPDFNSGDKTESWDGFVHLYRSGIWGVAPLEGRIPVQIKSTERPFIGETASHRMRTDDLRNYLADGGAMLFLISLNIAADTSNIFYANLSKEYLETTLCNNQEKKSIPIPLQRFPENQPDEMVRIFLAFLEERNKSATPDGGQFTVSKVQNVVHGNGIASKTDDLLGCLDDHLKEYILKKFEWYRTKNIAVRTPQILRMLLTYPNDDIVISNFNVYRTEDEEPYGNSLVEYFQNIDLQYMTEKRKYREQNWHLFIQFLEMAHSARITVSKLCYAILKYSDGTTVQMIKNQMGEMEFERVLDYILDDIIPSVPSDPKRKPHVVCSW